MAKIFYVEDDANLSFVVKDCLTVAGHEVEHYDDGEQAYKNFSKGNYDLALLDVMLPNVDGFTIAKKIRSKNPHIPIMFISAKGQIEDRIEGLSIGGDDYLIKPFDIKELLLKINIFLKRRKTLEETDVVGEYNFAGFSLDVANLILKYEDQEIKLTQKECAIITHFVKNQNKICKREEILIEVWGQDDYFLGRSLDVFITRIRKYFSLSTSITLENIPRVGFRLVI
jgi:DNA-binding response OmpR family regulator